MNGKKTLVRKLVRIMWLESLRHVADFINVEFVTLEVKCRSYWLVWGNWGFIIVSFWALSDNKLPLQR